MDYHIFRKPKTLKNKTVHRWYYYFYDPFTGKKIQKACSGCKNQAEAYVLFQLFHHSLQSKKSQSKQLLSTCLFQKAIMFADWINLVKVWIL